MSGYKTRTRGQATVEMPICLFLLLILFVLPLVDLATISLRCVSVFAAARNAAVKAARAEQYSLDSPGKPSARTSARTRAEETIRGGMGGVTLNNGSVRTYIIGIPLQPQVSPLRQEGRLSEVRPNDYLYQVEVELSAEVQPILLFNSSIFGQVPGLTRPISIRASSRGVCEHPSGLTI